MRKTQKVKIHPKFLLKNFEFLLKNIWFLLKNINVLDKNINVLEKNIKVLKSRYGQIIIKLGVIFAFSMEPLRMRALCRAPNVPTNVVEVLGV
jgi:glucan phosphoethanolaminetransferase (alkaline phosphatase superfamily)